MHDATENLRKSQFIPEKKEEGSKASALLKKRRFATGDGCIVAVMAY